MNQYFIYVSLTGTPTLQVYENIQKNMIAANWAQAMMGSGGTVMLPIGMFVGQSALGVKEIADYVLNLLQPSVWTGVSVMAVEWTGWWIN